jgi:hypothetical protein
MFGQRVTDFNVVLPAISQSEAATNKFGSLANTQDNIAMSVLKCTVQFDNLILTMLLTICTADLPL